MSLFQSLLAESPYELFLIIGDSNGDGRGATIPTVPSGTLYLWNGSGIDEITTQTVANDGSYGSAWQQFAIDYKSGIGKKVVIVQECTGGSEFYPNGDNNNWSSGGTLYTPAKDAALAAKLFLGVGRINVIVCLGINDIRGAQTAANIQAGAIDLKDRLNADLATPQIYWVLPGRDETNFNSIKGGQLRRVLVNLGLDANGHVAAQTFPFANWAGTMNVDNIHLTQAGYDIQGEQIARYMINRQYSKHTRSIISSFKDDVTSLQKTAINNFVNFFAAISGTIDGFQVFVGSSRENIMIDWGLVWCPVDGGLSTFNANANQSFSGSTQWMSTGVLQDANTRSSNTDFVEFVKLGTVTSSGTAYLFGKSDATKSMRTYQGGGVLTCQAYDATANTTASESVFASNSIYAVARTGTTKMLKKNASNVISVTQASTGGITTQATYLATSNSNGTLAGSYMNAEYKCWGLFQLSDFTWDSAFITALNDLITAMETP